MHAAWKTYRRELFRSSKSIVMAMGVSLLFFLAYLPQVRPGEHWRNLFYSLAHGFFIYAWIWVFYAAVHAFITHKLVTQNRNIKISWPLHVTLGFSGMAFGLISAKAYLAWFMNVPFNVSSLLESLVIGVFIALMFQFYYAYKNSMLENADLKTAQMTAELQVLKNQMQPHFLFNSLNSLAELIDSDKSHAASMTQNLADLYREILQNSKFQVASLASELSIVRRYLELEKLRFGDRLNYNIQSVANSEAAFIPSLMLQTLVENAVKHGISHSISGGSIEIKVFRHESGYIAEVVNSCSEVIHRSGQTSRAAAATGLENTKARLKLLYGEKHNFQLELLPTHSCARFWFSGENLGN